MYGKKFLINENNASEYAAKIAVFIKEKVQTANSKGVIIGMSGGIDCSVAACLARLANVSVKLVLLPYGEDMTVTKSAEHALLLIRKFDFEYAVIDVKPACDALELSLKNISDQSKLNIKPRVRMTALYAIAQTEGRLVVGTGNLDERLLGYFTKWGDGASDFNPLAMLTKGEVRILAGFLGVPREITEKPPSAGLYEGQTDEKDFGFTYAEIDAFVLNGTSGNGSVDKKINDRIRASEHKINPIPFFNG